MRKILTLALLAVVLSPAVAQATNTPKPPDSCACCRDLDQRIDQLELVFNQRITLLEQRISVLENTVQNLNNWITEVNNRISITINRVEALSCQSDRVYEFQLRREVDGSPVTGIAPRAGDVGGVEVLGQSVTQAEDGDRGSWRENAAGRFVITASYQGVEAPKGQLRTVTVYARTEDGKTHRLVQKLRLCLEDDGNPNDRGAQDRAEGQS